jgi:hypothetical protein
MSGAAPYYVPHDNDVGAALEFGVDLASDDGSPFPFDLYSIAYVVWCGGCETRRLTTASGLSIDTTMGAIDISDPAHRLWCGRHEHALELTEIATGRVEYLFDGPLSILGRTDP